MHITLSLRLLLCLMALAPSTLSAPVLHSLPDLGILDTRSTKSSTVTASQGVKKASGDVLVKSTKKTSTVHSVAAEKAVPSPSSSSSSSPPPPPPLIITTEDNGSNPSDPSVHTLNPIEGRDKANEDIPALVLKTGGEHFLAEEAVIEGRQAPPPLVITTEDDGSNPSDPSVHVIG